MARCGCSSTCSCVLQAGDGITVTGAGNPQAPYVITAAASGQLAAVDTATIDHTLTGTGTAANPYVLSSDAKVDPADGNILTAGPGGLSVSCDDIAACASPGGPLQVGCGLSGNGSVAQPLTANTAVWPFTCPDTSGGPVYCATDGTLRTDPPPQTVALELPIGGTRTANFCGLVTSPNTDTPVDSLDNRITVTNPDPCRPMLLDVQAYGRVRINTDDSAAGAWLNALGFNLILNGVDAGRIQQLAQGHAPTNIKSISYYHVPAPLVTLSPGGSVTIGTRAVGFWDVTCHVTGATFNHPGIRIIGRTV